MNFGKLVGNKYTIAGFVGGALAGGYDVVSNRRQSGWQVASDMVAGAGLGALGMAGGSKSLEYFKQFDMGVMANRTVKENAAAAADLVVNRAKSLGKAAMEDIRKPQVLGAAAMNAAVSMGLTASQGDADAGDLLRAGTVGALTGGIGMAVGPRLAAPYAHGVAQAMEAGTARAFLTNANTLKTLGISAGVAATQGAIDAGIGRQENSPMGAAAMGAVMGSMQVIGTAALLAASHRVKPGGALSKRLEQGLEATRTLWKSGG